MPPHDDPLMNAIIASPEDDEPRLVWADREGGERGELVVVQCALEKRDPSTGRRTLTDRAERKRLRARESALVQAARQRNAPTALSTGIEDLSRAVTFERGFPALAEIHLAPLSRPSALDDLFARAPLLKALHVWSAYSVDFEGDAETDAAKTIEYLNAMLAQLRPEHPLRSLDISASIMVEPSPLGPNEPESFEFGRDVMTSLIGCSVLRDQLEVLQLNAEDIEKETALKQLVQFRSLKSYWLSITPTREEGIELLRALPHLTEPPMTSMLCGAALSEFLATPEVVRLQMPGMSIHAEATREDIALIASSPALQSIREIFVARISDETLKALSKAHFADRIEQMHLTGDTNALTPSTSIPLLLKAFPSLEHLSVGRTLPKESTTKLEAALPAFFWGV